jgi:nitrogen fixation-related uncharacterized protein
MMEEWRWYREPEVEAVHGEAATRSPKSTPPVWRLPMWLVYVTIWGAVFVFGLTAVYGLVWALRTGQLQDFAGGAASIFDDDEPIGATTDGFPNSEGGGK